MKTVKICVLVIRWRGVSAGEFKMWGLALGGMENVMRGDCDRGGDEKVEAGADYRVRGDASIGGKERCGLAVRGTR